MWHPEREQNKNNELILKCIFHDKDLWETLALNAIILAAGEGNKTKTV